MESTSNDEENETGFGDFPITWSPGTLNWISEVYGDVSNNISLTDPGRMLAMGSFQGSMPTRTNSGSDIAATSGNGSSNFKAAAENALFQSPDEMGFQQRHGLLDGDGSSSGLFPKQITCYRSSRNGQAFVETWVLNEGLKYRIQGPRKTKSTLSCLDPELYALCGDLGYMNLSLTSEVRKLSYKNLILSWTSTDDELCKQEMNFWDHLFAGICYMALPDEKAIALLEIGDILKTVCQANNLPLALIWIPLIVGEGNTSLQKEKRILCIERMSYYAHNKDMEEFARACRGRHLEEGQGVAGQALQSNCPFFSHDVKNYDISEYPFVLEARTFGLQAAVAIRLRSTSTDDEYVLEFFLPVNVKELSKQKALLLKLYRNMKTSYKSLRISTDVESDSDFNFVDMMHFNVSKPKDGDELKAHGPFGQCIGTRHKYEQDKLQSHCRSKRKIGNDDKGIGLIHSTIQKEVIPEIGMEFEIEEEACDFYKTYASIVGFTVRMSKFHKANGKIIDRTFCCSREGWRTPDKLDVNVKAHRPETRCGCLAKMKINCRHSAGKYRVIEFVASHTHEISSPSENYLLESHGKKALAQANEVHTMDISRIPPKKSPKLMGEHSRKKFGLLVAQLEKRAAKSEEKCNFIISALDNILEEADTKFGDERIDED